LPLHTRFVQKKWIPRKSNANKLFFHLNGNAMYWLGGAFRDFYFARIQPYILTRHGASAAASSAMDLDIFEYLMEKHKEPEYRDLLISKIQYTGLIGNLYFSNPKLLTKDFVLIHAKPSDKW
jgi:hypothetical protein